MYISVVTLFFLFSLCARRAIADTSSSIAARYNITDDVLELTVHDYRGQSLRKRQLLRAPTQENLINYNSVYVANVMVGGQVVSLAIDTGSTQTWVATPYFFCLDRRRVAQRQSACHFGHMFDPIGSRTLRPAGGRFIMSYASGEFVEGKAFREQISIGGVGRRERPYFTVNQLIGVPEQGYWDGDHISGGVLGLALSSHPEPWSILDTLFHDRSIAPVFSLALVRPPSTSAPSAGGVLAFGGIPNIPTDGRWVETRIRSPSLDSPDVINIRIDGFDIRPPLGSSHRGQGRAGGPFTSHRLIMAVDSGTSVIEVPPEIARYTASLFSPPAEYHNDAKSYVVPCDAIAPRVGIKVAGTSYYISDADLLDPRPKIGPNVCAVMLEPIDDADDYTLGETWLRNVLVVFDYTSMMERSSNGNTHSRGVILIAGRER